MIVLDVNVITPAGQVSSTIGSPQPFKGDETGSSSASSSSSSGASAEPPRKLQRLNDNGEKGQHQNLIIINVVVCVVAFFAFLFVCQLAIFVSCFS